MNTQPGKRSVALYIILCVVTLVTIAFLLYPVFTNSHLFKLQFNYFATISATATALDIGLVVLLLKVGQKGEDNDWFLLAVSGMALYGTGEVLQRLSAYKYGAGYWERFESVALAIALGAFLLFINAYTGRNRRAPRLLMPALMISAAVMSFSSALYSISSNRDWIWEWGAGWNSGLGIPGFYFYLIFLASTFGTGILTLLRYHRTVHEDVLKKQSKYMLLAISVPITIGIVADDILPFFGITYVPAITMTMMSITCLLIFIGRQRHRFFEITDAVLTHQVLTTMNEAVIVTDTNFKIQTSNEKVAKLLVGTDEQLSHQDFRSLFSKESWEKIQQQLTNSEPKEAYKAGEVLINTFADKQVPVLVNSSKLVERQEVFAFIFVIGDITEITRSYKELEQLQQQLAAEKASVEHTVEIRTKELRDAQEELKASDQLKSEFLMLTSHNLRTPMAAVKGNAEMLKATQLNDEQTKYIQSLESSVKRLSNYTEELLLISSIKAGSQPELQVVSINEVIKPLAEESPDLVKDKEVKFIVESTTDDTVFVKANVNRLRSAIRNILDNAFKFTEHGSVTLKVASDGKKVTICVKDTGIGIDAAEIPRLFTTFHRATSSLQYDYEGAGIGLSLTKLIINEQGGEITLTTKLHEGSTFFVTLPQTQLDDSLIKEQATQLEKRWMGA